MDNSAPNNPPHQPLSEKVVSNASLIAKVSLQSPTFPYLYFDKSSQCHACCHLIIFPDLKSIDNLQPAWNTVIDENYIFCTFLHHPTLLAVMSLTKSSTACVCIHSCDTLHKAFPFISTKRCFDDLITPCGVCETEIYSSFVGCSVVKVT